MGWDDSERIGEREKERPSVGEASGPVLDAVGRTLNAKFLTTLATPAEGS